MGKTDFLFIDNTPSLPRREVNANGTAIRQFVQKHRKARKAKPKPPSRLSAFPESAIPVRSNDRRDAQHQVGKIALGEHVLSNFSNHMPLSAQYHRATTHPSKFNSSNALQVHRPVDAGLDPFHVTPVKINDEVYTLLQYYEAVVQPNLTFWPHGPSAVNKPYGSLAAESHALYAAFHDNLSMKCLLAACITRLCHVDNPPGSKYRELEAEYISCALHLMRKSLDQTISSPRIDYIYLIQNILHLSSTEAYRGNISGAHIHFRACLHLLMQYGVRLTEIEEDVLRGNIIILDQYFACLNLERCVFEPEFVTVDELDLQRNETQVPAPRFQQMTASFDVNPYISADVKALVSRIKDTYMVLCSLDMSSVTATRRNKIKTWIRTRCTVIRTGLLSAFETPRSQLSASAMADLRDEERIDIAVRIALILFTFMIMEDKKQVTLGGPLAPKLRQFIEPLLQRQIPCWETVACADNQNALLFWITVIGVSCATDGSETKSWFEENAFKIIASRIKLHSQSNRDFGALLWWLEQSQIRYLYHASGQRSCLEELLLRLPTAKQLGYRPPSRITLVELTQAFQMLQQYESI